MVAGTVIVDLDAARDDNLGLYVQAIGRTPLLSREREHELGMMIHMGRRALVRARRHLAARLRHALLEQPAGQDMLRELAVAGTELLDVDAALLARWICAAVVACAERPLEDSAATDVEAMETTLALVARGDSVVIARLLDLGLRAGVSPSDAGMVVAWIRSHLTARVPIRSLVPDGATTDESLSLSGDAIPEGSTPDLYLDGIPLAESRAGAALYGVAGLGDATARRTDRGDCWMRRGPLWSPFWMEPPSITSWPGGRLTRPRYMPAPRPGARSARRTCVWSYPWRGIMWGRVLR